MADGRLPGSDLRVLLDVRESAWVLRRQRTGSSRVDALVPGGFGAYATATAEGAPGGPRADRPGGAGPLLVEGLAALCDLLAAHTSPDDECVLAVAPGWPALADVAVAVPRARLLDAEHVLVAGPLSAVLDASFDDRPGRWWARPPALLWPRSRVWCAVSPPGEATLVGGSVALVEDLLAWPGLAARPVHAHDPVG